MSLDDRREQASRDDYWLANCEGFQVEASGGLLGIVEAVQRGPDGGDVHALLVVGGLLGNRRWVVPAVDVAVVQPRRQRVALIEAPAAVRLVAGRTLPLRA